ncbi:MAG: TonB-dependent receptor, partial [Calditrichales bacterium]
MKLKILFYVISIYLLGITSLLQAQPTGKVAGFVVDVRNGEPLAGVNVSIKNQMIGAATDLEGQFVILNVPAGKQIVEFTFIGYKTYIVENVEIKIDRTTQVNGRMEESIMELDEAVVVTAERPVVEKDKTSSSIHLDEADIRALPVEGLRDLLELTPGINRNADGTISVRGGGAYEINYMVNGIKSLNTNTGIPAYGTGSKSDNNWKYDINPLAVAQMEVISGGFNAEYGNAQSGVVKVATREGGKTFTGGFIMEYRAPGQYHWGDYLYSKDQPEWQAWGNIAPWYDSYRDSSGVITDEQKKLAEINYKLWLKNHTPSDENILGVYDYRKTPYTRYLFSLGGPLGKEASRMNFFFSGEVKNQPTRLPTSEKVQELQNYSLVLSWKPGEKHHFKLTNLFQYYRSGMGSGSLDIRWAGLWGSYGSRRKYTLVYDSPREETVFSQSLDYRYIFSARSFLEATLTHQSEVLYALQTPTPGTDRDKQLNPDPEDRLLEDTGIWLKGPSKEYRTYYTWSSLYNQASVTDFYELRSNYSVQLTPTNLFKAGVEAWMMDQDYNASSSLSVSAFIWRTGFATNYKAKTWYAAGYLQDKMEFAGMVANLGLRLDAYNFGVDKPIDENNFFYPAEGISYPGKPGWEKSKTFYSLSPRVGISFPIGERTAFRAQYGHFYSMPSVNQALDNQTFRGWNSYGNPDLKPKLSVNYEVGVQQNLWNTHLLDIVTYYNDRKNQIYNVYVRSATGSQSKTGELNGTYLTYRNNGYGSSRGIELTFQNRNNLNWRYSLSYAISQTSMGY